MLQAVAFAFTAAAALAAFALIALADAGAGDGAVVVAAWPHAVKVRPAAKTTTIPVAGMCLM